MPNSRVIVRHPADLQGETIERQHRKTAAESKVTPEVPPMNIRIHIAMHHDVVVEFDRMRGFTAHLDRPLHDMSINVPLAAMAEAVYHGSPTIPVRHVEVEQDQIRRV